MSGRRAIPRTRSRGRFVAVACVTVLVAAVCTAGAWILHRHDDQPGALRSRGVGAENSPMDSLQGPERDVVPDACTTLSTSIADRLAPDAQRSETSATQTDEHSECAWSLYGSPRGRQLTVELRAIGASGGKSATDVAISTFNDEWRNDREGNDLADTAKVRDSRGVTGVGEQAYVVYTVDTGDEVGEAVTNARLANVLVTVHYSGGDDREGTGTPLSSSAATDGALSAARDIISKLESHS